MRKPTTGRRPRAGTLLAAGFLTLGLFLMTAVLFSVREQSDGLQLRHALDVEVDLGDLLAALLDAEVGQRGYLLTGDDAFLGPYRASIAKLDRLYEHLGKTVRNDPGQAADVVAIGDLITQKRTELARTIALHDAGDRAAAIDLVRGRTGMGLMDRLRQLIGKMDQEQEALYQGQKATTQIIGRATSISAAVALVLMGALALAALSEVRKRARLQRFLPSEVASRLADDDRGLREGRSGPATVAFVDIRGSTALAESLSPTALSRLLTRFRGAVSASAREHGGMVDKFIGDGALVVFGALDGDADAPAQALAFAQDLLARLAPVEGAPPSFRVGIGLHCGEIVCGIVGDADRQEFTVLGDTVNVASRIEQATKQHATDLLVSEAVLHQAGADPMAWRQVDGEHLRGHRGAIALFTPRRDVAASAPLRRA